MTHFLVSRMNSLAHFVPLAHHIKNSKFILLCGKDQKYNSVALEKNSKYAEELLQYKKFDYIKINSFDEISNFDIKTLFSLEGNGVSNGIKNRKFKHIVIQNYHDFSFSAQYPKTKYIYENADIFWVQNKFFKNILKEDLEFKNKVFIGTLPCYWEYENRTSFVIKKSFRIEDPIAVCFLPRPKETIMSSWKDVEKTPCDTFKSGNPQIDLNHAFLFAEKLKKEGFKVIFKQRIKNRNFDWQSIENYTEDFAWFPNVSLDFLKICDIAYGYMTSAVLDASVFGTRYFNFSKTKYPPITEKIFEHYKEYDNISLMNINDNMPLFNFIKQENNLTESIKKTKKELNKLL